MFDDSFGSMGIASRDVSEAIARSESPASAIRLAFEAATDRRAVILAAASAQETVTTTDRRRSPVG
jgi:hypothetical protein